jgi:hypothetical protein
MKPIQVTESEDLETINRSMMPEKGWDCRFFGACLRRFDAERRRPACQSAYVTVAIPVSTMVPNAKIENCGRAGVKQPNGGTLADQSHGPAGSGTDASTQIWARRSPSA